MVIEGHTGYYFVEDLSNLIKHYGGLIILLIQDLGWDWKFQNATPTILIQFHPHLYENSLFTMGVTQAITFVVNCPKF